MSNEINILSSKHKYSVEICAAEQFVMPKFLENRRFAVLVDRRVNSLYGSKIKWASQGIGLYEITAEEDAKDLEQIPQIITKLLDMGIRRGDVLVSLGGGVLQDIVCFISSVLFRGIDWAFIPTTLLAQADSCIGSKSSINVCGNKNQVGSFWPPIGIHINTNFLNTLEDQDIDSGIGEIIKIFMISAKSELPPLEGQIPNFRKNRLLLTELILKSLKLKKKFVEEDEFDQGPRLVLNYGHTFGHAIESATKYEVPHGVAVSMGMDMANFIAWKSGRGTKQFFEKWHPLLHSAYERHAKASVDKAVFFDALKKDKKNSANALTLILPDLEGNIVRASYVRDGLFDQACEEFFSSIKLGHSGSRA